MFDIVLLEKHREQGLTKTEVVNLHDMLSYPEGYPIEITETNGNSFAMRFITPLAADALQYEYDQDIWLNRNFAI